MYTDFQILSKLKVNIYPQYLISMRVILILLVLIQSVCNYDGRAGVLLHQWVLVAGGRVITP